MGLCGYGWMVWLVWWFIGVVTGAGGLAILWVAYKSSWSDWGR